MKLERLIPQLPGAALLVSDEGRIRCASPGVEDLFGFHPAELVGEALDTLLQEPLPEAGAPDTADAGAVGVAPARLRGAEGAPLGKEGWRTLGRRRDGGLVPVAVNLVPLARAEGPVVLALLQDLSDMQAKDLALLRSHKLETLGRLTTGVAHDFNNLLTLIAGGAGALQRILPEGHEGRAEADAIIEAQQRAASLTRRLLRLARDEARRVVPVDVNEVVGGMEPILSRLFADDVRIELRLEEGLGPVRADPDEIGQVVLNLAVNAREAMPEGGTLTFVTETVPREPGALDPAGDEADAGLVRLRVSDTGVGMDEPTRARIFESFFTTKRDGSGLGLPTVREIVERCGGTVAVDSAPGHGSRFSIDLPAARVPEGATSGP